MQTIAVGQQFVQGRTSWPEGAEYNYTTTGHELKLFFSSPTEAEIRAARRGEMNLAIYVELPLIEICYEIKGLVDWSDAPYTWHVVPQEHRSLPSKFTPEQRALLLVLLIDADTGILRAIRQVSMTPDATKLLHSAIADQASSEWNEPEYMATLNKLYKDAPTAWDIVKKAQIVFKAGL